MTRAAHTGKAIRILADDLTGALDTAAAFAGEVPVYLDTPPANAPATAVTIVSTPTRDVAPAELEARLRPVLTWFAGADLAFKKLDSLLRGNSFAEVAWLVRRGEFASALFAPAFPAQGRVTEAGQQWVVDAQSPGAAGKRAAEPFAEAFAALGAGLATEPGAGGLYAPDVRTDADLDRLVADVSAFELWCGSAGLAHALARRLGLAPAPGFAPAPLPLHHDGPTLLVSASHHPVLREQWQILRGELSPETMCEEARENELDAALAALQEGAASAWFDLSPRRQISAAEAASALATQMSRLVAASPKPAQLIVVGGDTLLSACRASAAVSLLTAPSIKGGWGCARLQGGVWDGVPCYSRSGAFGAADDLLTMIRLLGAPCRSGDRSKGN